MWPGGASQVTLVRKSTCQSKRLRRCGYDPWVRKTPWRRKWQPTPVFLPRQSHGQRRLGARVHSDAESDTTERLTTRAVHPGSWWSRWKSKSSAVLLWCRAVCYLFLPGPSLKCLVLNGQPPRVPLPVKSSPVKTACYVSPTVATTQYLKTQYKNPFGFHHHFQTSLQSGAFAALVCCIPLDEQLASVEVFVAC